MSVLLEYGLDAIQRGGLVDIASLGLAVERPCDQNPIVIRCFPSMVAGSAF
jgi:hypothetical protein